MQIIDTKTHGYIDYIFGLTLIAIAYLLNFNSESTPNIALCIAGTSAIVYSLFTNYELGVVKIIPMNIHLMLDSLSGIFLAVSPWLLGFSDKVFLPHLLFGLIEIGTTVITRFKPKYKVYKSRKLNHNGLQKKLTE
jgi:MFS superfamily sulfate permease-like transporter